MWRDASAGGSDCERLEGTSMIFTASAMIAIWSAGAVTTTAFSLGLTTMCTLAEGF